MWIMTVVAVGMPVTCVLLTATGSGAVGPWVTGLSVLMRRAVFASVLVGPNGKGPRVGSPLAKCKLGNAD